MFIEFYIKILIFLIFALIYSNAFETVKFEPFRPTDSYKCGQFIAESTNNDPAIRLFQNFNNKFIRLLSQPFPHESKKFNLN